MSVNPFNVLGYHTAQQWADVSGFRVNGDEVQKKVSYGTIDKLLSYIPVIGTIIGLVELFFQREEERNNYGEKYAYAFTARAVVATLSLGCLFIIPDIVFTALRAYA